MATIASKRRHSGSARTSSISSRSNAISRASSSSSYAPGGSHAACWMTRKRIAGRLIPDRRGRGRPRAASLQRAQHEPALRAHREDLLLAQILRELVELALRSGDGEGDLRAEQMRVLVDLALEPQFLGAVAHRLLEFGSDELADERDEGARFELFGVPLACFGGLPGLAGERGLHLA